MSFRQDDDRIRKGDGAQNYSIVCRLALTLLKREKIGVKAKRPTGGWDTDDLLRAFSRT